jgi:NAD(P)-dependent dehydrogenase (short-subunit alcohol dehydrogenase family)
MISITRVTGPASAGTERATPIEEEEMAVTAGRLAGKVVLISGTGGGQGREAARIFAREGAHVVGCDIVEENAQATVELVRADGHEMLSLAPVDLADPEQAKAWVQAAVDEYGHIDRLYNNASLPRFGPFADVPPEDYAFTMRNEIDLYWYTAQAAWPHLAGRPGAAILNIGSIAGVVGLKDMPQAAHAVSKGAVIGMTAQLAAEGAAVGIRVNCVSPGVISSPPVQEILAIGERSPLRPVIGATAIGQPGEPEDIVYAALYLLSDEAKWVTGAHLVVDGGSSVLI